MLWCFVVVCLCFCFLNKKLIISEPAMCKGFSPSSRKKLKVSYNLYLWLHSKGDTPRVISLHGHITTYLFLLLLCCAISRKRYGTKISAKSSDEGRGDSFYSLKYALWAQKSIYNVVFVNTKMQPMKSSSLLCWLILLLRHNTNWHIIMFSYCQKTEPNKEFAPHQRREPHNSKVRCYSVLWYPWFKSQNSHFDMKRIHFWYTRPPGKYFR